jgi:hypothetical protein
MLTLWLLVLRRRPESEGQDMRARCDPIDTEATLRALAEQGCGLIGPSRDAGALRRLYADYASVAARPYARATWEGMLRTAERKGGGVAAWPYTRATWEGCYERRKGKVWIRRPRRVLCFC